MTIRLKPYLRSQKPNASIMQPERFLDSLPRDHTSLQKPGKNQLRVSRSRLLFHRLLRPIGELNRDLRIIFISNILTALGIGLYTAVWPLYVAQLGGNPIDIGAISSLTFLVTAFVFLPGGYLADRYDRKLIVIITSFATTPAFFIYAWAHTWVDLIPGVVFFNLTLIGVPAFSAYIAGSVSKSHSMSSFAVLGAGFSAGFIFSPLLGGWLLTFTDFRTLFYLAAIFWVLSTVILFPLTPQLPMRQQREHELPAFRLILRERRILYWILLLAAVYSIVQIIIPFIPKFLADTRQFGLVANQYAGSVRFFGATFLGVGLGRLGDRWHRGGALAICLLILAGGVLLLILETALAAIIISMLLLGTIGVFRSLGDSIIGRLAPKVSSAQIYSFYLTLAALGQFFTPFLGGYLYTASPQLPFVAVLVLSVTVAMIILFSLSRNI